MRRVDENVIKEKKTRRKLILRLDFDVENGTVKGHSRTQSGPFVNYESAYISSNPEILCYFKLVKKVSLFVRETMSALIFILHLL